MNYAFCFVTDPTRLTTLTTFVKYHPELPFHPYKSATYRNEVCAAYSAMLRKLRSATIWTNSGENGPESGTEYMKP